MSMGAIWASVLVVYVPDKPRRGASAFQEKNKIRLKPG